MKTVISAILSLASLVAGEAIECRGSAVCGTDTGAQNAAQVVRDQIAKLVQEGSGDRHFATDELIACARGTSNSFCAFYQQGASGTAKQALDQVQQLINRGCKRCGTVKVNPQNAADGVLTVNYREKPCCDGNCHC